MAPNGNTLPEEDTIIETLDASKATKVVKFEHNSDPGH
jgi:hypothetical protein